MKASFYKKLQSDFSVIRFLQYEGSFNLEEYKTAFESIKEARRKIKQHSAPGEKKILLYCIDTLFEVLSEGDTRKSYDFADAIHNIPEIYMQKRDLYSFRKELKSFQRKYGRQYFPFIDEVKPRFTKKAPKNKWKYFSASSDEDFKLLHPIGYKVLCAVGITVLTVPMIAYLAYVLYINPAPNEWFILLGQVGAFIVGVGFFNIVAAWIHQYLGHLLTVICIVGGLALTLFSMHLLYT